MSSCLIKAWMLFCLVSSTTLYFLLSILLKWHFFLIGKKEIVLEKPKRGEKSTHEVYKQRQRSWAKRKKKTFLLSRQKPLYKIN